MSTAPANDDEEVRAMPATGTRVAIVDDHELLAQSLQFALMRNGMRVDVITPTDEIAVVERLVALAPDLVLLDFNLGDIGPALPIIEPARAAGAEVVIMTGETSRVAWGECLEAGAVAVLAKSMPFQDALDRITGIAAGETPMPMWERDALLTELREHRASEQVRMEPFQRLTVREEEVLQDLMDGLSAETIAERAFVSIATVRSHIRSILQKLGVNSQLAAVAMAARAGWRPGAFRRPR